jgi:hypothetical protein
MYEVRDSTVGPGWKAIYEHTRPGSDSVPETRVFAVLQDDDLKMLIRALVRYQSSSGSGSAT